MTKRLSKTIALGLVLAAFQGLGGIALAQDPNLEIILESNRTLSNTVQTSGNQGVNVAEQNLINGYNQARGFMNDGGLNMARVIELNATMRAGTPSNMDGTGGGLRPGGGPVRSFLMPTVDSGGQFRTAYPNANALPVEAQKLDVFLREVNTRQQAGTMSRAQTIRAAADAHTFIVQNHLFADGNGRTARMVADTILMRGGLPPASHNASSYMYDRSASPEVGRERFRLAMQEAVTSSETRVATRTATGRGAPPPEGAPGTRTGSLRAGGTPPQELELLGRRSGATFTSPTGVAATLLPMAVANTVAGGLAHQWARGEDVSLSRAAQPLATGQGWAAIGAGTVGFIGAEYLASTVLANAIPIPGVGRLIGKPLANMAIRSVAGAAGAQVLANNVTGQQSSWGDIAGSAVASGVGMAVGQALIPIPFVGAMVGGIVGSVAYDIGSAWYHRRQAAAAAPAAAPQYLQPPKPGQ